MNISNLAAYRNIGSANINNPDTGTEETSSARRADLAHKEESKAGTLDTVKSERLVRPTEGVLNLQPVERYRYMQSQAGSRPVLDTSGSDPKRTIQQANDIINNAIMPPGRDNPDMAELTRAIQIRQMMQGRLDLAA